MLPSVTKKGADGPTAYSVTEPGAMQVPPQLPAGWAGAGARGFPNCGCSGERSTHTAASDLRANRQRPRDTWMAGDTDCWVCDSS